MIWHFASALSAIDMGFEAGDIHRVPNSMADADRYFGLAKKRWWHDAVSPAADQLHRTLKKTLDPNNILNPGKFLG